MTATISHPEVVLPLLPPDEAYLQSVTPETFTEEGYLASVAQALWPQLPWKKQIDNLRWVLNDPKGRKHVTHSRLALFCLIYLRGDFVLSVGPYSGQFTVNDLTLHAWRTCGEWLKARMRPKEMRWVWASPRESGKSTMVFKAIPLWLAAHKHARFIAAFAHTHDQAKARLGDFRNVLHFNKLIMSDYPSLVAPARRGSYVESDTSGRYKARSGFTFYVSGAGGSYLGLLSDGDRPDTLLLDDLEAGGENFGPTQTVSRLGTLRESILGLSQYARVLWSGTTVGYNSLIHQALRSVKHEQQNVEMPTEEDAEDWRKAESFQVNHFTATVETEHPDGSRTERSMWPAKWTLDFLHSEEERSPRTYGLNFQNMPLSMSGGWWTPKQLRVGVVPGQLSHVVLAIDPAVSDLPGKSKATDPTGIAIVGWDKNADIFEVLHVESRQMSPETLHARVLWCVAQFPELTYILFEGNRSDGPWARRLFHDVRLKWLPDVHQRSSKDVRVMHLHQEYEDGKVLHRSRFPSYEEQCLSWAGEGSIPHDDELDAVAMAVSRIRHQPARTVMHF